MAERKRNIPKSELLAIEEKALADEIPPTSMPAEVARQYLGLPEDVKGLVIVDVCAGFSSLTADLLESGADAHAVDRVFGIKAKQLEKRIDDSCDSVVAGCPQEYSRKMRKYFYESADRFKASYAQNPDRYHRAYATKLPFPDNFSDYSVSVNGVSGLIEGPEVMQDAIAELIRITKPGGRIVLSPWFTEDQYQPRVVEIHQNVVRKLESAAVGQLIVESGIPIRAEVPVDHGDRVTIIKNS